MKSFPARLWIAIGMVMCCVSTAQAQPAATPAVFLGKWSGGQSAYSADKSVSFGSRVRQYDFRADGTYSHHAEAWGGTFNSNWFYIVNESGTWAASGDQLTLTPTTVAGEVRDLQGKLQKNAGSPPPLEKPVSYRFRTNYFSGIQETQLILTTEKATIRDGSFAQNDAFPNSYLLSNNNRTKFRFPLGSIGN